MPRTVDRPRRPGGDTRRRPYRQPRSRPLPAVVAAVAGIVTMIAMFLPWYRVTLGLADEVGPVTGWSASSLGKIAFLCALVWTGAAIVAATDHLGHIRLAVRTTEYLGYVAAGASVLCGCIVAYRIAQPPGPTPDFMSRDFGILIAIAGCVVGCGASLAVAARR